jgi:plastocyanin
MSRNRGQRRVERWDVAVSRLRPTTPIPRGTPRVTRDSQHTSPTKGEDVANETSANTGQKDMGFVIAGGVAMALIILAITVGIRIADPQGGGGGGGGGNTEANITLSEYKIDGTLTVPAGNVVLNITNSGSVEHNLQVVELGKKTANLKAGQSEKLDLGTLEPGVYNIDCTVAGHKDSGMSAKLTVTEGGGGLAVAAGDASGTDGTEGEGAVTHSHDELANGLGTPEEYAALDKAMNDSVTSFLSGDKAIEARGTLPLESTTSADGYKVFNITAEIIDWEVEKGKTVKAWAYNKQVPGRPSRSTSATRFASISKTSCRWVLTCTFTE